MTPAQLDLLLAAEDRLSASADSTQRASDPSLDLIALAHARKGR